MEETISIEEILKLMLHKLWIIILALIMGAAAAFCVSTFLMPLKYQSYTTMYVKNKDANNTVVDNNDLSTAKSLVTTYIAVLQSDTIMLEVGDLLIEDYGEDQISRVFKIEEGRVSPASLRACLTMSAVDNTEVMKITAVTTDPELSAALCGAIAQRAPDFLIRVVGAGSVETIDEAQPSYDPVSPNTTKNTLIGALAGAMLAVVIIFLIDFFDDTVKDPELLSEKFKKSMLGEIYDVDEGKKSSASGGKYLITDPKTPFYVTESYKAMRTNLMFSLSTTEKKIFAVSSALPNEGKSTIASNIAIALSQLSTNRVLLIDGDMRKPVQHKIFKITHKMGLSTVLGKMAEPEDCIQRSVMENFDVMPSGRRPPNPAELLSSERMETLLEELSEQYDYIIIDMPPVNVVSDPLSIGRLIAGLVVVVRNGVTTFNDVSEVMKKTELSDTKVLGFAMTRIKQKYSTGSYYHRKYGYKYEYNGYGRTPSASKRDNA